MTKAAEKASQKNNQDAVPVSNQAVNDNLVTPPRQSENLS